MSIEIGDRVTKVTCQAALESAAREAFPGVMVVVDDNMPKGTWRIDIIKKDGSVNSRTLPGTEESRALSSLARRAAKK